MVGPSVTCVSYTEVTGLKLRKRSESCSEEEIKFRLFLHFRRWDRLHDILCRAQFVDKYVGRDFKATSSELLHLDWNCSYC